MAKDGSLHSCSLCEFKLAFANSKLWQGPSTRLHVTPSGIILTQSKHLNKQVDFTLQGLGQFKARDILGGGVSPSPFLVI